MVVKRIKTLLLISVVLYFVGDFNPGKVFAKGIGVQFFWFI